ncbi:phosphate ABC transporter permease subunit PstC [Pasteurella bettyae]|uniref:Phosphate transport system permease protein n=1 Tax=Pasteurella bettyae CCUG 2042 TaxID=1095749 RepID=I3D7X7_9PAST|nr:phosphate ABC transporter permease subunit PstC [Pasteurella bettyae]EIJ67820.1 phosphate ABC transporter, permease protein PstC [Pasteurella bettyae CCUG 2042]
MKKIKNQYNTHKILEWTFHYVTKSFACIVFLILISILVSLVYASWESIQTFGLSFLWTTDWNPSQNSYGAFVPIVGTLISTCFALIIAVPISLGIATFLTELAPEWAKKTIGLAIEMLAAIPSIIYGMWGLFVFVPYFQENIQPHLIHSLGNIPGIGFLFMDAPFGIGLFSAGLVLAIMIIPFIASIMREVFTVVPHMLKESAYGLGATTWEVIWNIILPYTKTAVIGGVMLGIGRALGETMAITFVIGNAFNLPNSIFSPTTSITSAIANQFNEAAGLQKSALMELGLFLFLITTVVLIASRLLIARITIHEGKH